MKPRYPSTRQTYSVFIHLSSSQRLLEQIRQFLSGSNARSSLQHLSDRTQDQKHLGHQPYDPTQLTGRWMRHKSSGLKCHKPAADYLRPHHPREVPSYKCSLDGKRSLRALGQWRPSLRQSSDAACGRGRGVFPSNPDVTPEALCERS